MTIRMEPGYAYKRVRGRFGDETVVVSESVTDNAKFLGYREIDGSRMGVFKHGRSYYAQLAQNLRHGDKRRRLKRIFQGSKYLVEARTPKGWQGIYTAPSLPAAKALGAKWTKETGQKYRVVAGDDHPDHRGFQVGPSRLYAANRRRGRKPRRNARGRFTRRH